MENRQFLIKSASVNFIFMKKLLTITALFFPALLFAQSKTGGFVKEHLFIKVSPALLISTGLKNAPQTGSGVGPAILGAVGAKMRFAALGFSAGYCKLNEIGPVTLPLGLDVTITDFKKKKTFPVITTQWYKVHATEHYYGGHYNYDTFGKDMFSLGAGLAFPLFKTVKVQTTLSYSKMNSDTKGRYFNYPNRSEFQYKNQLKMAVFAVSMVL